MQCRMVIVIMLTISRLRWLVVCGLALAACGGHTLNVGSNDAGPFDAAPPPNAAPTPIFRDSGGPQVWNGHLVKGQLANGSNALTMTFSVAADGTVSGTLLLGDGAILQPPTDPSVGYPPGIAAASVPSPVEGFPYTIRDGVLTGTRLTFDVAEKEVWTQWCALQTPRAEQYDLPDGATTLYRCGPPATTSMTTIELSPSGCFLVDTRTEQQTPIDCGEWDLCESFICQCSPSACEVNPMNTTSISFDVTLQAATADGTMMEEMQGVGMAVHFIRAQ